MYRLTGYRYRELQSGNITTMDVGILPRERQDPCHTKDPPVGAAKRSSDSIQNKRLFFTTDFVWFVLTAAQEELHVCFTPIRGVPIHLHPPYFPLILGQFGIPLSFYPLLFPDLTIRGGKMTTGRNSTDGHPCKHFFVLTSEPMISYPRFQATGSKWCSDR